MTKRSPFCYSKTSPEVTRLAVMMYVRFPLSLRNVEDLLHERGVDVSHETIRFWWNCFGPMFASKITRKRRNQARSYSNWQWHFDEVFVKINGERYYLWRAVDHEGEVLESDLPPEAPSFITRVCGFGFHILRRQFEQARRVRSPQISQALGALQRVFGCPEMSAV